MDPIPYQTFQIILSTSSRSIKQSLINHQFKYVSTKSRTDLHSRLNLDINNKYQQNLWVLPTFVPNKSFGQLSNTSPTIHIYKKHLVPSFHKLKYGLLIKTPDPHRYKKK